MVVNERNIDGWTPAPASVVARRIGQHEELGAWLRAQVTELLEHHPDEWVGTGTDRVLVFGDKLEHVVEQLKSRDGEEGVVAVRFLSSRPRIMIL